MSELTLIAMLRRLPRSCVWCHEASDLLDQGFGSGISSLDWSGAERPRIFIDELPRGQIAAIERPMLPGACCRPGYLRDASRLADLISQDNEALGARGITHEQIVARLESIVRQALRQWEVAYRSGKLGARGNLRRQIGSVAPVEGRFRLAFGRRSGVESCRVCLTQRELRVSFRGTQGYSSQVVKIENLRTKESIKFSEVTLHYIRNHHFFEGDKRYRLAPSDAIRVLEIVPGADYSTHWEEETLWTYVGFLTAHDGVRSESGDPSESIEEIVADPDSVLALSESVRAFVREDLCVVVAFDKWTAPRCPIFDGALLPLRNFPAGVCLFDRTAVSHVRLMGYGGVRCRYD